MLTLRFMGAVFLAGCAATSSATAIDGQDLNLDGRMDSLMLDAVQHQEWKHVRAITFSSSGGLTNFSVPIARILAGSAKPITIRHICASACLDVLAIPRVRIEAGTLILLHNTPAGQSLTTRDYPVISAFLARLGDQESQWLKENGVDPRLTLIAEASTVPVCVSAPADTVDAASQLLTLRRFDAWAPKDTTLTALGVNAARFWRQDTASVLRTMRISYPKANLARLRPANEPAMPSADAIRRVLMNVHICKPSLS